MNISMAADTTEIAKLEMLGINSGSKAEDGASDGLRENKYHLLAEQAVCLDKTYITDMSVKDYGGSTKIAVALSSKTCMVQTLTNNQFKSETVLKDYSQPITNVRFSWKNENLVLTSSLDGKIKLWDLRRENSVKELKDESGVKPLTCFDLSCDDQFVCAGTELVGGDAFIIFWDIRSRKLLGGYWESHTDDITQIAFHPDKSDLAATGSIDGLINVFDISKSSEEDALMHSLNTESSVAKISWHKNNQLSCLTHTETVQLWDMEGAGPEVSFAREKVAEGFPGINAEDCYMIDIHEHSNNELFLLAGYNCGKQKGLRTMGIEKDKFLSSTELVGNRQVVRTSFYNQNNELLFTAGEGGCICVWKPGETTEKQSLGLKKLPKSRNKHKSKPY